MYKRWMLLILLASCAGGERQACYASAEAAAWQDAETSCFGKDVAWEECPERQRILDELEQRYRGCP